MSETSRITKPGLQESALRLSQGYFHHKPVEDCPRGQRIPGELINPQSQATESRRIVRSNTQTGERTLLKASVN